jgi:CRISPR system Cascade subunit CasE
LVRDEALESWLRRKEEKIGVRFTSIIAIDEGYLLGRKERGREGHRINIKAVRYDGIFQVVSPELISSALRTGIGPAKAFGCGLLSVARS